MTLYVVKISENTLITHDGEVQLGVYSMSMNDFLNVAKAEYVETYWIPDTFCHRYKRINFQKHLNSASIGTKNDSRK